MILYGDAGTVLVHQPRLTREGQRVAAGQVQLVTRDGSQWIDPPPLPPDQPDGPTYFLSCVRDGRPVEGLCAPEVGRDVQEILGLALRSATLGREVPLSSPATEPHAPQGGPERALPPSIPLSLVASCQKG
jgi:predicted dehydrogenase